MVVRRGQVAREDTRRELRDEVCIDIVVFGRRGEGVIEGALVAVGGCVAGRGTRGRGHLVEANAAECGGGERLDGGEATNVVN